MFAVRAKPTAIVIPNLEHCDLSAMLLVCPLDHVDVPWDPLSARQLRLLFVAPATMCVEVVKAMANVWRDMVRLSNIAMSVMVFV